MIRRSKRGLVKGLGHIINSIIRNLDSEEDKKYTKILNEFKDNECIGNNQLKEQYYFTITEGSIKGNEKKNIGK